MSDSCIHCERRPRTDEWSPWCVYCTHYLWGRYDDAGDFAPNPGPNPADYDDAELVLLDMPPWLALAKGVAPV